LEKQVGRASSLIQGAAGGSTTRPHPGGRRRAAIGELLGQRRRPVCCTMPRTPVGTTPPCWQRLNPGHEVLTGRVGAVLCAQRSRPVAPPSAGCAAAAVLAQHRRAIGAGYSRASISTACSRPAHTDELVSGGGCMQTLVRWCAGARNNAPCWGGGGGGGESAAATPRRAAAWRVNGTQGAHTRPCYTMLRQSCAVQLESRAQRKRPAVAGAGGRGALCLARAVLGPRNAAANSYTSPTGGSQCVAPACDIHTRLSMA